MIIIIATLLCIAGCFWAVKTTQHSDYPPATIILVVLVLFVYFMFIGVAPNIARDTLTEQKLAETYPDAEVTKINGEYYLTDGDETYYVTDVELNAYWTDCTITMEPCDKPVVLE